MLLVSLGLTISTCLSGGCGQIAVANNMAQINESAIKIIQKSIDNFDYGNYSLTFNEQESFSKQKLLSFAEENQLFTVDILKDLKTLIESDANFAYFGNIDELFIRDSNVDSVLINQDIKQISTRLNSDLKAKSTIDNIAIDKGLVANNNFSDITFTVDDSGGASGESNHDSSNNNEAKDNPDITPGEEIYKLPAVPCDANNLSTLLTAKLMALIFLVFYVQGMHVLIYTILLLIGLTNKQFINPEIVSRLSKLFPKDSRHYCLLLVQPFLVLQ